MPLSKILNNSNTGFNQSKAYFRNKAKSVFSTSEKD